MSAAEAAPSAVAPLLLDWWDEGHADWPWRRTRDPYAIWVAEVMLQQTQLAVVLPYYERWLTRFPTVQALAAAPLDDVLKVWEGLGYYSRARHLHAAAQRIVAEYGGELPRSVNGLLKLPGIGRYTAGAVASIAFGVAAPAVDGNVLRVLARLTDCADDITRPATRRRLEQIAAAWLPAERPGDFNEALMELGQRVCTADPACVCCPLAAACLARQRGVQRQRPVRAPRAAVPHVDVAAGVIYRADGRFLIARRPLRGLLGGLWEFPGGKQEPDETLPETLVREIAEELGIAVRPNHLLVRVKHAYTHLRITLHAYHADYLHGAVQHLGVSDHAWVTPEDLDRYAFAAADRKIIAALRAGG